LASTFADVHRFLTFAAAYRNLPAVAGGHSTKDTVA